MEKHDINLVLILNIRVPSWANDSSNERLVPAIRRLTWPSLGPSSIICRISGISRSATYPILDGNWDPDPSAMAYTDYLRETYTAIKEIRPKSIVLAGGLGYNEVGPRHPKNIPGPKFLEQMYQAGAKPYFDVVSFHTYWWPGFEANGLRSLKEAIPVMKRHGDESKPIWITEYGPPERRCRSGRPSGTLLREQYETLAALPQVRNIMWHDFRDATKGAHLEGAHDHQGAARGRLRTQACLGRPSRTSPQVSSPVPMRSPARVELLLALRAEQAPLVVRARGHQRSRKVTDLAAAPCVAEQAPPAPSRFAPATLQKGRALARLLAFRAEMEGFEPSRGLNLIPLSRRAH